jgi:hypothetical protein
MWKCVLTPSKTATEGWSTDFRRSVERSAVLTEVLPAALTALTEGLPSGVVVVVVGAVGFGRGATPVVLLVEGRGGWLWFE